MSAPKVLVSILLGFSLASTSACAKGKDEPAPAGDATAMTVDYSATDLDGRAVSLSSLRGKRVYVKFWASWCPICLAGMPEVEQLAAKTDDDVEVLTVASPEYLGEMDQASFRTWAKNRKFRVPILVDQGGRFAASLGIDKYPSSIWLDPDGKLLDVHTGQVSNDWILSHFDDAKASTPARPSRFPPNPNAGVDYRATQLKEIWFAGGCFWGVEAYFTRVYGVADAISGYANGSTPAPSYEDVIQGSGHAETVLVRYDPARVSLERLVSLFFKIIDPTSLDRQGNDRGRQYRTGIYYTDPADGAIAKGVMAAEQKRSEARFVTELVPLAQFAKAEPYHQDYLEKHPDGYCHTDFSSLSNTTSPNVPVRVDSAP